jgi:predicted porin
MNKKLIALALAGAFAAPVAMAQTANPVTLYGRVHLTFEHVEAKGGTTTKRTRVMDQASLLGVRGTEDLGGGLKAFFQLETGFAPDQFPTVGPTFNATGAASGTGFANRNSGVGLQGGWGSILMGRWDTPFKVATGAIDPFGDVTIAGITVANNDQANFDRRDGNVVQYWSPSWGGFAFRVQYQSTELKTAATNPYDTGFSVTFTRGPVYAFYTYEKHKNQSGGSANALPPGPVPFVSGNEEGNAAGGTWTIGNFRLGGNYQWYKKSDRTERESWLGNVIWTIGKSQLIYQYQQSEDGGLKTAATQPECDSHALAWQYNFSRRTFTQLIYTKTDNNAVANCGTVGGSMIPAGGTGTDPQGFSFGIRHIF